jgi:methylenetetrahydrofolate dehydrogenase (NADP+)/methenyltetrahydrofolate cyclohydrolase
LPAQFQEYKAELLSLIAPDKDIDGLWWVLTWLSSIWLIDFVPATARAIVTLLRAYNLYDLKWKKITVIWQSNLSGKPLVDEFIKQEATVYSCNIYTPLEEIKALCKNSDYIVSCTWCIYFVNQDFVRDDQSQILVDVWYWYKDGKAAWDIDFEKVKDKVKYISPVPGWVWPLTVASIFANLFTIEEWLRK